METTTLHICSSMENTEVMSCQMNPPGPISSYKILELSSEKVRKGNKKKQEVCVCVCVCVCECVCERSEEHTSELQSHLNLVCRLLSEKKTHVNQCVAR